MGMYTMGTGHKEQRGGGHKEKMSMRRKSEESSSVLENCDRYSLPSPTGLNP